MSRSFQKAAWAGISGMLIAGCAGSPAAPPRVVAPGRADAPPRAVATAPARGSSASAEFDPYTFFVEVPVVVVVGASCEQVPRSTERGIVLEYTSKRESIEQLREQVQHIADAVNRHETARAARHPLAQAATFGLRSIGELRPVARVTPTPDGARLELVARGPSDVVALRANVLWYSADFLPDLKVEDESDRCPILPGAPRVSATPEVAGVR